MNFVKSPRTQILKQVQDDNILLFQMVEKFLGFYRDEIYPNPIEISLQMPPTSSRLIQKIRDLLATDEVFVALSPADDGHPPVPDKDFGDPPP